MIPSSSLSNAFEYLVKGKERKPRHNDRTLNSIATGTFGLFEEDQESAHLLKAFLTSGLVSLITAPT